jgi:hypothetical protein
METSAKAKLTNFANACQCLIQCRTGYNTPVMAKPSVHTQSIPGANPNVVSNHPLPMVISSTANTSDDRPGLMGLPRAIFLGTR